MAITKDAKAIPKIGLKYWRPVEHDETLLAEWEFIPPGTKVLEIGPGPGHMTEALFKKKCQVTAIEMNPEMAPYIQPSCKRVIIANIEHLNMESELGSERFDVILLGDVLEHLQSPELLLRALKNHLAKDGFLVVSMPNVAHASVRLALLNGNFNYQRDGLLDSTHLRFFTLKTITDLFHNARYVIQDLRRIRKGFFDTSISVDPSIIPIAVLKQLCEDPDAETYQFVFRAVPIEPSVHPREVPTGISSVDQMWNRDNSISKLAMEYMRRGYELFWNNPPNDHLSRKLYYRALALNPRPKALMYIIASFFPRRILNVIHWLRLRTYKIMNC